MNIQPPTYSLDEFVKNWRIFIDTCSLLHESVNLFWPQIVPVLQRYSKTIVLPNRCIEEINKHAKQKKDKNLAERARQAQISLQMLINSKLLEVFQDPDDNFADNVFQVVFTKNRLKGQLLLITQDVKLARTINGLNRDKACRAFPVKALRLDSAGNLTDFDKGRSSNSKPVPPAEKFRLCTQITRSQDVQMNISHIPGQGEYVYASNQKILLVRELNSGGEGIIYETNTPYVAKIYKKLNNTRLKYEKIQRMLSKKVQFPGICYPIDALMNSRHEFVGLLIPKAEGTKLFSLVFTPAFKTSCARWKRRDLVELCITILKKIQYLHDRNILLGDINPYNIIVKSTKEVFLVDTDSYQIEEFPCPVGIEPYFAPEIIGKHCKDFMRTFGNEYFAVATLLFMINLPGKPPYSQQGGDTMGKNILNMRFPYPLDEKSNNCAPEGDWKYIWSHLTYEIKNAFYHTFQKNGQYSTENNRLSVQDWLRLFEKYLYLLDSGVLAKQDPMSLELFPTRFKRIANVAYTTCKLCRQDVPQDLCREGICRDCLNQGETYSCKKCGQPITYTNYQKYIKKAKRYTICQACYIKGHQPYCQRNCIDCGKSFTITNNDCDYYLSKGWDLPLRCPSCRKNKKNHPSTPIWTPPPITNTPPPPPPKPKGNCFITTAICGYLHKPDDCEELVLLRHFRDLWLVHQPDGLELIMEYERIAPGIVQRLEASPNYEQYCRFLWEKYLLPCLELIKNFKFEECKNLYIKMVRQVQRLVEKNS